MSVAIIRLLLSPHQPPRRPQQRSNPVPVRENQAAVKLPVSPVDHCRPAIAGRFIAVFLAAIVTNLHRP
jgi:hypothetical protein